MNETLTRWGLGAALPYSRAAERFPGTAFLRRVCRCPSLLSRPQVPVICDGRAARVPCSLVLCVTFWQPGVFGFYVLIPTGIFLYDFLYCFPVWQVQH